ncbi:MAG: hypothetical protein ACREBY_20285 [Polaromonas sp.]
MAASAGYFMAGIHGGGSVRRPPRNSCYNFNSTLCPPHKGKNQKILKLFGKLGKDSHFGKSAISHCDDGLTSKAAK